MSTMIERVAAVISPGPFKYHSQLYHYCLEKGDSEEEARKTADWAHGHDCKAAIEKARAAIEAMREPTDAMKPLGADAFFSPSPTSTEEENERAASVYRRMIDAALKEAP